MPLQTRNIAKGVPPRVHLPKSTKPKPSAGKKNGATKAAPTKKDCKRHAGTSGDESEEQSEDLEPKARKKRARREATTSEEEAEEVDDDPVPKPPMEHVNDVDDEQSEQPDEDEVSTNDYISQRMDQLTGWALDELNTHQRGAGLEERPVKKVSSLDILTIMSDRVKVKFMVGADKFEVDTGRWCNICK